MSHKRPKLIVLDVDNTLLHTVEYSANSHYVAQGDFSSATHRDVEDFYRQFPEGGIPFSDAPFPAVYPRHYLQEFLTELEQRGFKLAIYSSGTREYLQKVLHLVGIDVRRFVAIWDRTHTVRFRRELGKDLQLAVDLGFSREDIIAIDDRRDLYFPAFESNVIEVTAFFANIDEPLQPPILQ